MEQFKTILSWGAVVILGVIIGVIFSKLYFDVYREGRAPLRITPPVKIGGEARVRAEGGELFSRERVDLKFAVGGRIAEVSVEDGDFVEEGQIIARLEDTHQSLMVAKAENYLKSIGVDASPIQLEQARIDLKMAEAEMERSYLRAPFSGTILKVYAHKGELVGPAVPVATLANLKTKFVRATVSEVHIQKLAPGQRAEVTFDAIPERIFEARVDEIGREARRVKGREALVEVILRLEEDDPLLIPGLTAYADIFVPRRAGSLNLANWFIGILFVLILFASWFVGWINRSRFANVDRDESKRGKLQ